MRLSDLQDKWKALLAFAAAICTLLAGFLVLPQIGLDPVAWSRFGIVMVALLVGLWLVPMQLYGTREFLRYWGVAAVVCFVASVGIYVAYSSAIEHWTFAYPTDDSKSRVVTGKTLSDKARAQADATTGKGKDINPQALYARADGEAQDVWPSEEERSARLNGIIGMYLLELFLLPSAMVTVVQASACAAETAMGEKE